MIQNNVDFTYLGEKIQTQPIQISPGLSIGGEELLLILGPCSVENYYQTRIIAETLFQNGIRVIRGGAFKPRTSPYTFQGLGDEGLRILRSVADEFNLLVVTEALGIENIPLVAEYADIIQIGSRNMQHFPLLWAAAETGKPILLKRGFMASIQEWLLAAEHIVFHGNEKIILCERGIRTFETMTRNTFDAVSISLVKQLSPFPVIGDPSHATGRADLILPASRIALAAGADGLIVEFHSNPEEALSDSEQALNIDVLPEYLNQLRKIAEVMRRKIV